MIVATVCFRDKTRLQQGITNICEFFNFNFQIILQLRIQTILLRFGHMQGTNKKSAYLTIDKFTITEQFQNLKGSSLQIYNKFSALCLSFHFQVISYNCCYFPVVVTVAAATAFIQMQFQIDYTAGVWEQGGQWVYCPHLYFDKIRGKICSVK